MITESTIATLGFPIAVCIYLLYERYMRNCKFDKTLKDFNKSMCEVMKELNDSIIELKTKIESDDLKTVVRKTNESVAVLCERTKR